MDLIAKKSFLRGTVPIPGSKSHTIRMVALGALAQGESELIVPLASDDTLSAVNTYRQLGAEITLEAGRWIIRGTAGQLKCPDDVINVGNSGTTMRFALGSAALLSKNGGSAVFTGDSQIRSRPVGPLLQSLNDLGAKCISARGNGKAPVVVQGKITGGQTSIEAVTSQYLSALLFNTPLAENDTIIDVTLLNEKPYVQITLDYLDAQGIEYKNEDFRRFTIRGGQNYHAMSKRIPGDFSSATFFLCAGLILDADIVLEGLDFSDAQGDKAVVDILRKMGGKIEVNADTVRVCQSELQGIEIDMNNIPDALPAMAVVGCLAQGKTRLYNVAQARLKETDRIKVMVQELRKMGAEAEELPDGMIIKGSKLHAAKLKGHSDHRIVMALSLAAMAVTETSRIDTAEAVKITFPNYAELMQNLGANLKTNYTQRV